MSCLAVSYGAAKIVACGTPALLIAGAIGVTVIAVGVIVATDSTGSTGQKRHKRKRLTPAAAS